MNISLVSGFMDWQPTVTYCNTPLVNVVQVLINKGITGAPVINSRKEVLGFISEKTVSKACSICIASLLALGGILVAWRTRKLQAVTYRSKSVQQ